jgi:tricorn protease interacting factor F2/3
VHLKPDLDTFDLHGRVEIRLEILEPVNELNIHAAELQIFKVELRKADNTWQALAFDPPDAEKQTFTLRFSQNQSGEVVVRIEYKGLINDSMLGFYRSKYKDAEGREKYLGATQFEENEAHKAFPCFDDPALKATFDIEYVIEESLTGISNMPVIEEKSLSDGWKLVRFERTPVMSTYLLFFGVGEFEIIEDPGEILIRVIATPGKAELAKDGLAFSRQCLEFLEEHFATKYPLPKLDLIALPDFAFGAMENWGAMTFRENLLLVYPGITSRTALKRIFAVIAHEIVHQWFGDLVSPAHWKYLWLNESFATLYGDIALDHYHPDWSTMDTFLLESTASALSRDSLNQTFAIELGEEAKITASTAPIIYEKGGSVLHMAVSYMGEKIKGALQVYFEKFAYSNTQSSDLWKAFEEVAGGEPIVDMMKSWVEQPGYPLLDVKREGNSLIVAQERFTYLNDKDYDQHWIVPLQIWTVDSSGQQNEHKHLLSSASSVFELPEDVKAFKLNYGQSGFYRVKYEDVEWEQLGEAVKNKNLPGPDRYGLQEDLFVLARRGDVHVSDYCDFVSRFYTDEDFHLPLRGILKNLSLLQMVLKGPGQQKSNKLGKAVTEKILARFGLEPSCEEPLAVSTLRSVALWNSVLFGSDKAVDYALRLWQDLVTKDINIHPDIADAVYKIVAFSNPEAFPQLLGRFETSDSEQERMIIAASLGCVPAELRQEMVDYALDKIPPRLRFIPLSVVSGNPVLIPHLWELFRSNRERLETLPPVFFERVLMGIISLGGLSHPEELQQFFKVYTPHSMKIYQKHLQETVDMSLEMLAALLKLREKGSTDLP